MTDAPARPDDGLPPVIPLPPQPDPQPQPDPPQVYTPPPPPPPWEKLPGVDYSDIHAWVNGEQVYLTVDEAEALTPSLETLRAAKVSAIRSAFGVKTAAGFTYQDLVIDIDDGSRADLGGMALSAVLAVQKVQPWPSGMSRGWIARGGSRIELPEPADGLALANGAATYYSALVQHEQDLEDAVQAATDAAGVTAVDEGSGWPG